MGLYDAIGLANNIITNKMAGNNIGEMISLASYEEQAKLWNYSTAASMELLLKTFEIQNKYFTLVRNLGMDTLNSLEGVK